MIRGIIMKINYRSKFLAIIFAITLFVCAGFAASHEHTAFAKSHKQSTKTYKWHVGVPKNLQGKSYYTTSKPYTFYNRMWFVYFGKKNIYFGELSHGKINFKKNIASYLTGNDFYDEVEYRQSGKNYYLRAHKKGFTLTNGTTMKNYKTIGEKKVIINNKIVLTENKANANKFLKSIDWFQHDLKSYK